MHLQAIKEEREKEKEQHKENAKKEKKKQQEKEEEKEEEKEHDSTTIATTIALQQANKKLQFQIQLLKKRAEEAAEEHNKAIHKGKKQISAPAGSPKNAGRLALLRVQQEQEDVPSSSSSDEDDDDDEERKKEDEKKIPKKHNTPLPPSPSSAAEYNPDQHSLRLSALRLQPTTTQPPPPAATTTTPLPPPPANRKLEQKLNRKTKGTVSPPLSHLSCHQIFSCFKSYPYFLPLFHRSHSTDASRKREQSIVDYAVGTQSGCESKNHHRCEERINCMSERKKSTGVDTTVFVALPTRRTSENKRCNSTRRRSANQLQCPRWEIATVQCCIE